MAANDPVLAPGLASQSREMGKVETGRIARLAARTGNMVTRRRPWAGWQPCRAAA